MTGESSTGATIGVTGDFSGAVTRGDGASGTSLAAEAVTASRAARRTPASARQLERRQIMAMSSKVEGLRQLARRRNEDGNVRERASGLKYRSPCVPFSDENGPHGLMRESAEVDLPGSPSRAYPAMK